MSGWFRRLKSGLRRRGSGSDLAEPTSEAWEAVTERARMDMEARRRALTPLADVVGKISAALLEEDPVDLGKGIDADEYDSEAETIVLRLADRRSVASEDEVLRIVHEEFVRWFGADLAGTPDRFESVAAAVHRLWGEYLAAG
jgi:hypothetical protein